MSKAFELLKEYGVFYVATMDGDKPAVRPFGAIMEYKDELCIVTANVKAVYKQIKANPAIELCAWKAGTHDWVRVAAKAVEKTSPEYNKAMLEACPVLVPLFHSADNPVLAVFALTDVEATLYTAEGSEKL